MRVAVGFMVRTGVAVGLAGPLAACATTAPGADVACVQNKLSGADSVSMPDAAKLCGHMVGGHLAPLDLRGATPLQVEAKTHGVAYTQ